MARSGLFIGEPPCGAIRAALTNLRRLRAGLTKLWRHSRRVDVKLWRHSRRVDGCGAVRAALISRHGLAVGASSARSSSLSATPALRTASSSVAVGPRQPLQAASPRDHATGRASWDAQEGGALVGDHRLHAQRACPRPVEATLACVKQSASPSASRPASSSASWRRRRRKPSNHMLAAQPAQVEHRIALARAARHRGPGGGSAHRFVERGAGARRQAVTIASRRGRGLRPRGSMRRRQSRRLCCVAGQQQWQPNTVVDAPAGRRRCRHCRDGCRRCRDGCHCLCRASYCATIAADCTGALASTAPPGDAHAWPQVAGAGEPARRRLYSKCASGRCGSIRSVARSGEQRTRSTRRIRRRWRGPKSKVSAANNTSGSISSATHARRQRRAQLR